MYFKDDFDLTKRYFEAFWNQDIIDRPAIAVTAPLSQNVNVPAPHTPKECFNACMEGNLEPLLVRFLQRCENTYFGGEALPFFEVTLGPDQYAGFLGARIEGIDGADTTWAYPAGVDIDEFEISLDKTAGGYYDAVINGMAKAAEFSENRFFINMLDLHSNLDALSALFGPMQLCIDILDRAESVERALNAVNETYEHVLSAAFAAGDMQKRGCIGWAPTYLEKGRFAVLQCDFSCMLGSEQARRFVIPAIEYEASKLDRCVYHLDGKDALKHLDDILAIDKIDCIQWVPGAGQPRTIEWMELLQKIQRAGKSVWIYDWSPEEIKNHFKELRIDRVFFSTGAQSADQADELIEYLKNNS